MTRGLLPYFCWPPLLGFLVGTGLINVFLPLLVLQLAVAICEDVERKAKG